MSGKSEKRAKTLLEYMGFKDPDIKSNLHDEWCLRCLDDNVIKRFFYDKMGYKTEESDYELIKLTGGVNTSFLSSSITRIEAELDGVWKDFPCGCKLKFAWLSNTIKKILDNSNCIILKSHKFHKERKCPNDDCRYKVKKFDEFATEHRDEILGLVRYAVKNRSLKLLDYIVIIQNRLCFNFEMTKEKCFISYYYDIIKINKKLEHVLSSSKNNFRFGFLDVYAFIEFTVWKNIWSESGFLHYEKYVGNKFGDWNDVHHCIVFFEIKTGKPSLGEIAREIEYYKDIINSIYSMRSDHVHPFVIAPQKYDLPNQFDSISFDEFNTKFQMKGQLEEYK